MARCVATPTHSLSDALRAATTAVGDQGKEFKRGGGRPRKRSVALSRQPELLPPHAGLTHSPVFRSTASPVHCSSVVHSGEHCCASRFTAVTGRLRAPRTTATWPAVAPTGSPSGPPSAGTIESISTAPSRSGTDDNNRPAAYRPRQAGRFSYAATTLSAAALQSGAARLAVENVGREWRSKIGGGVWRCVG